MGKVNLKDYLFFQDGWMTGYCGDAREVLKELPDKSVQMCVTSPPYWGLRNYGIDPLVWGGDGCEHEWGESTLQDPVPPPDRQCQKCGRLCKTKWFDKSTVISKCAHCELETKHTNVKTVGRHGIKDTSNKEDWTTKRTRAYSQAFCQLCNAWRGSLGLEPTPELYVQHLVEIFREVKRVLRDDGTIWVNMGDSYFGDSPVRKSGGEQFDSTKQSVLKRSAGGTRRAAARINGLKPKDLIGIPWRVAFALQADGWWLRRDVIEEVELYCPCGCGYVLEERIWRYSQDREIIWHKTNPMPESAEDRPTTAHEYLFLLSKKHKYYYDADAIKEKADGDSHSKGKKLHPPIEDAGIGHKDWHKYTPDILPHRNKRSVWTIPTQPSPEVHFATFPEKLVEPCILAGTSEKGCCPECGSPWERVVEKINPPRRKENRRTPPGQTKNTMALNVNDAVPITKTIGWQPTCKHKHDPIPCTVLDPFAGTGTVAKVARDNFRKAILIDIKAEYCEMAVKRLRQGVLRKTQ